MIYCPLRSGTALEMGREYAKANNLPCKTVELTKKFLIINPYDYPRIGVDGHEEPLNPDYVVMDVPHPRDMTLTELMEMIREHRRETCTEG